MGGALGAVRASTKPWHNPAASARAKSACGDSEIGGRSTSFKSTRRFHARFQPSAVRASLFTACASPLHAGGMGEGCQGWLGIPGTGHPPFPFPYSFFTPEGVSEHAPPPASPTPAMTPRNPRTPSHTPSNTRRTQRPTAFLDSATRAAAQERRRASEFHAEKNECHTEKSGSYKEKSEFHGERSQSHTEKSELHTEKSRSHGLNTAFPGQKRGCAGLECGVSNPKRQSHGLVTEFWGSASDRRRLNAAIGVVPARVRGVLAAGLGQRQNLHDREPASAPTRSLRSARPSGKLPPHAGTGESPAAWGALYA